MIVINNNIKQYKNSKLLVVTKNRSQNIIKSLINDGYSLFGENRVQEANEKFSPLIDYNLNLHLIGPLQTNKVKLALSLFDTIQTIDRPKLVNEISKQINSMKVIKTKNFFIQINVGNEPQKAGMHPDDVKDFYNFSLSKKLNISGLMCIPPIDEPPDIFFKKMNDIKKSINPKLLLSMGMSNDYETALSLGSNLVRIGSRIFK